MDITPRILLLRQVFIGQKRNKAGKIGVGKQAKVVEFDCFCPFFVEHREIARDRYGQAGRWSIAKGGENRAKWAKNGRNCSIF